MLGAGLAMILFHVARSCGNWSSNRSPSRYPYSLHHPQHSLPPSVSWLTCPHHCNLCLIFICLSFKLHLSATSHWAPCPTTSLQPHNLNICWSYILRIFSLPVMAHVSAAYNTTDLTHKSVTLPWLFTGIVLFTDKLTISVFSPCYCYSSSHCCVHSSLTVQHIYQVAKLEYVLLFSFL